MPATPLSIYTIRHRDALASDFGSGAQGVLQERKRWVTGERLLSEARRTGETLPLILADAADSTPLLYWAVVEDITYDEDAGVTTCRYANMRRVEGDRPLSALTLRNGRSLSDDYIRPYAICKTPHFITL